MELCNAHFASAEPSTDDTLPRSVAIFLQEESVNLVEHEEGMPRAQMIMKEQPVQDIFKLRSSFALCLMSSHLARSPSGASPGPLLNRKILIKTVKTDSCSNCQIFLLNP